ncbi:MAG: sigma-70 family RNA polymerase sigma factor [Candidatus Hydrogenedentes bacterium]|nr:sigma-70 family RNA polymerase sigma factor [Candidatus Hydrogenedentota bacterium]
MTEFSDWDLVARARSGELNAYAELVRRHQSQVIHFCMRMTRDRQDAEDLAQECFVRVYRYLDRLRPEAKFSTVLFGIARNLTLNFIRDAGRRGRGITQSLTREGETERLLEDALHRPDREARRHEIEQMIERGLERLSAEHREIIVLREVQGMDYEAIAEILKCRLGTVKSRLARAREQLRVQLVELGGELL